MSCSAMVDQFSGGRFPPLIPVVVERLDHPWSLDGVEQRQGVADECSLLLGAVGPAGGVAEWEVGECGPGGLADAVIDQALVIDIVGIPFDSIALLINPTD